MVLKKLFCDGRMPEFDDGDISYNAEDNTCHVRYYIEIISLDLKVMNG